MGITRFKSFEEAERALWVFEPDNAYYQRIRDMFELAERLCPARPQTGISKFRSIGEKEGQDDYYNLISTVCSDSRLRRREEKYD